jgi:3'(2'), 5'-bisphosphate nucleotidase
VADYSAQAVVNTILSHAFPDDPIVGEEDSADLRAATGESAVLRARVVELADDVLVRPPLHTTTTTTSGDGGEEEDEREEWGVGRRWGAEALLEAIDRGSYAGGRSGRTLRTSGRRGDKHLPPTFFFFF